MNIRWKSLDEIYKLYTSMLLHRSDLNISAKFRQFFGVLKIRNARKFAMFSAEKRSNFSKFLDFNLIFIMKIDYTTDLFNFRLNFQFNFHRAASPKVRMASGD